MQNTIKKVLRKNVDSVIIIFLFMCPFLDVITSISIRNTFFGTEIIYAIKLAFMFLLISYVFLIGRTSCKRKVVVALSSIFLYFLIYMLHFNELNESTFLYEAKEFVKYYFFPVAMLCLFSIYEERHFVIENYHLSFIFLIYAFFIVIPTVLGIGFASYEVTKSGSVGWFFSLNEIGAILSILFPFLILQIHRMRNEWLKWITIIGCGSLFFMVGSKTPILVYCMTITIYFFIYIINLWKKRNYTFLIVIFGSLSIFIVVFFLKLPDTNFYRNLKVHSEFLNIDNVEELLTEKGLNRFVFSDRLTFAINEGELFEKENIENKMLGMGSFINSNSTNQVLRKTVEMDYFDILYKYGIIGFIVYFVPITYIILKIVKLCNSNKKKASIDLQIYTCSITLGMSLALFSGHIFSSPSVSIFLATIYILALRKGKEDRCYHL